MGKTQDPPSILGLRMAMPAKEKNFAQDGGPHLRADPWAVTHLKRGGVPCPVTGH